MATITVEATDKSGSFSAYLLEPKNKPAGAVVLIQEIFGVNQAMRDSAAQVADMGFFAVCPDLFWRVEPGVDITDKSEAEWKKAFELMNKFDQQKGVEDLKATVAAARKLPGCNGRVGTMGYCLGGRLAFMMAEQSDADVNISYYGVGLDGLLGDQGDGRHDPEQCPQAGVDACRHRVHRPGGYPGEGDGHGQEDGRRRYP